jgi:hypothetical protein
MFLIKNVQFLHSKVLVTLSWHSCPSLFFMRGGGGGVFFSIFIPVAPTWSIGHPEKLIPLQFLDLRQLIGLLGWGISPSQGCYLTQTQNTRRQTSMPWVGFKLTIPAFKLVKTFHALDHAATVIGYEGGTLYNILRYVSYLLHLTEEGQVRGGQP